MLRGLFALTLFVSAALLFLIQPMIGKLLLPLLGGTPAVWNTCLVFFQSLLLMGYLYAHVSLDRFGVRRQSGWHSLVLIVPLLAFAVGWLLADSPVPVVASLMPTNEDYPILPLLVTLFLAAGPTFVVLATTGPLLSRWYGVIGKSDPYVLYAASNAGSLLGLLAYPFLVEPRFSLRTQQLVWAMGVVVYVVLVGICAALTRLATRHSATFSTVAPQLESHSEDEVAPIAGSRICRWLAFSALTAALLSSGTTHLTTDVAPMPLLWVVPLSLYLLSFIVVFSWWPPWLHRFVGRLTPTLLIFLVLMLMTRATEPLVLTIGLPLLTYFAILLTCHGELSLDRPAREHLTGFYLYVSLGSVLGSLFCALIAPILFHRFGLVEYPLALVLAALVRPSGSTQRPSRFDLIAPALLGLLTAITIGLIPLWLGNPPSTSDPNYVTDRLVRAGITFGVPCVLAYALVRRPLRYALCLAALLLASTLDVGPNGRVLRTERNFFGTLRVTLSNDGRFIRLVHGTTQHGQQAVESDEPLKPLTYYHPTGPAGRVMNLLQPHERRRVGAVGLGCGAMASYARPGESWIFYEIDPAVLRIAQDTRYFTYLECCEGELTLVPGDARRQLERETDHSFDVLILDAFSSDAIPVHLLTREAMELYAQKLRPDGVLLFHVSNRYLDLPPLLARLARHQGLAAFVDHDFPSTHQREEGKLSSTWMLLGTETVQRLASKDRRWQVEPLQPGPVWTDAFSNLLGVWKREEN